MKEMEEEQHHCIFGIAIIAMNLFIFMFSVIAYSTKEEIREMQFPFDMNAGNISEKFKATYTFQKTNTYIKNYFDYSIIKGCSCRHPKTGKGYCGNFLCRGECTKKMEIEEDCFSTSFDEKISFSDLNGTYFFWNAFESEYTLADMLKGKLVLDKKECPSGYKVCGRINDKNKICLKEEEECPINSVVFSTLSLEEIDEIKKCPHIESDFNYTLLNGSYLYLYTSNECTDNRIIEGISFVSQLNTSYLLESFYSEVDDSEDVLVNIETATKGEILDAYGILESVKELPNYPLATLETDAFSLSYGIKYLENPFKNFLQSNFDTEEYEDSLEDLVDLALDSANMTKKMKEFKKAFKEYQKDFKKGALKSLSSWLIRGIVFSILGLPFCVPFAKDKCEFTSFQVFANGCFGIYCFICLTFIISKSRTVRNELLELKDLIDPHQSMLVQLEDNISRATKILSLATSGLMFSLIELIIFIIYMFYQKAKSLFKKIYDRLLNQNK